MAVGDGVQVDVAELYSLLGTTRSKGPLVSVKKKCKGPPCKNNFTNLLTVQKIVCKES